MRLKPLEASARLNQVGYKLAKTNSYGISALRFSFTNGVSSESISTEQGNSGNFITIPVDEKRIIRKVCMKVKDDKCLYGLRFIDNNGNNVLDLSTQSEGTWVERVIPEGKELYGIRCSTLSLDGKPNDAIHQLGFTLRDSKEQPKPQTEQPAPVAEPAIQKPSKYERMTPKEKFITIAKEVTDKYGQFEEKAPQRSGVRIKKALVVLNNGEMY